MNFHGAVGQAVSASRVTQVMVGSRLLTNQEQAELTEAIHRLERSGGQVADETLYFLQRAIGVNSVKHMRLEHLEPAFTIVELLQECADKSSRLAKVLASNASLQADSRNLNSSLRIQISQLEKQLHAAQAQNNRLRDSQQKLMANQGRDCPTCASLERRRKNWMRLSLLSMAVAAVMGFGAWS